MPDSKVPEWLRGADDNLQQEAMRRQEQEDAWDDAWRDAQTIIYKVLEDISCLAISKC